jgi:hypothetical protein
MAKRRSVGGSEVRTWAKEQGREVGTRGRFSDDLVKDFHKANTAVRYEPNHVPTRKISGTRVTESGRKVPVTVTATLSEVRAFAQAEGLPIGKRGRVGADVLAAFAARPKVNA